MRNRNDKRCGHFANPKLIQHHVIAHRSEKRVARIYSVAKLEPYGFRLVFSAGSVTGAHLPGWRKCYMSICYCSDDFKFSWPNGAGFSDAESRSFFAARDDRPRFSTTPRHTPRKRSIQYSRAFAFFTSAAAYWITRRSLSSGGHSADPLAGDDDQDQPFCGQLHHHLRAPSFLIAAFIDDAASS